LFPGQRWGGMSADPAIFSQSALDMTAVENDSDGEWRIFSKRGNGYSTSRLVGEIVTNAYLCLPMKDGGGIEVTLSAKGSVPNDTSLIQVQAQVED